MCPYYNERVRVVFMLLNSKMCLVIYVELVVVVYASIIRGYEVDVRASWSSAYQSWHISNPSIC